jgi:cytochrome c oxidase subunit 2
MWKFQHPTGQTEINTLHVPVGRPVRLTMISQDVIHSFYVPAFRLKRDVLPGYYTTLWFEATKAGEYHLFCAEYCGTEHADMVGRVVALEPNQYQNWLSQHGVGGGSGAIREDAAPDELAPQSMAQSGSALFQSLGCSSCHQMDGRGVGPPLAGVYGSEVELQDGETRVADAQYIRDSILDPNAQVVAGYSPIMPSYAGQVSEEELLSLLEYIRSLTEEDSADQAPADTGGAAADPSETEGGDQQ